MTLATDRPGVDEALSGPAPGIRGAAGLSGAATLAGIALTATSGWLVVAASHQPVILTLLAAIVAVRAFGIARPVLRYAERVRSHDAALALLTRRRAATYRALVPLTPARLGRGSRSDVLTAAVQDLEDLVFAKVRVVVPVLGGVVAGVGTVLAVGYLVPAAGVLLGLVVAVVAAACLVTVRCQERGEDAWLAARAHVSRVAALVAVDVDRLQGVSGQDWARHQLAAAHRELAQATRRQARARSTGIGAVQVATGAATLAAAGIAVWARGFAVGDAIAALVVLAPLAVAEAAAALPDAMASSARATGSARRLRRLLDQPPAVASDPRRAPPAPHPRDLAPHLGSTPPRLTLHGVTARWQPGGDDAPAPDLARIDLDIAPGDHVALVGESGSGKSTLLAVLARQLDPADGTYRVGGVDVRDLPVAVVRDGIAVLDDDPHVFASTLRENLRLARPDATDTDLTAALDRAGLRTWFEQLPDGLDTALGATGRGVSGGERARLGVARVVVSDRPVVLLDEPVAHLDHPTATRILADLFRACRGRTVVMASHRAEGLDDVDRVLDLPPTRG